MEDNNNNSIIKTEGIEMSEPLQPQPGPPNGYGPDLVRMFNDFTTFEHSVFLPGTTAANDANHNIFYIASAPCFLIEARVRYSQATGVGGTTLRLDKVLDGDAVGSVKALMTTAAFDITATANTVYRKSGTISLAGVSMNPGDSITIRPSATPTSLANLVVTCLFGINNNNIPRGSAVS